MRARDILHIERIRIWTYREGHDMENFQLVVGMKFKNALELTDVLREYIVRGGLSCCIRKMIALE